MPPEEGRGGGPLEVPRDLLLRRYPPFVTGGQLPRGQVPVFVFHSLEPDSFERKLAHIADNGYQTLSADEYFQVLMGVRPPPERAVLLSFDDGRGSVFSVAYPLMQRRGLKGVVFLVPGRMHSRPPAPTLNDVRDGHAAIEDVLRREQGAGAFLSWEEVDLLARSGLFTFESHTLTHARVHVSAKVAGFLAPDQRRGYAAMDVPLIREGGVDRLAPEVPLGTPLLHSAPRTSETLRFIEDPTFRAACVALVADAGGEAFFGRADWRRRLQRALGRRPVPGRVETPAEQEAALRRELADARTQLEARTGRPVTHLCYPWHVAGPTARRLAREAGYRTAFCGKVRGVPITLAGGDPLAIARLGDDYVELLPGRGRASLLSVLRAKWRRRLSPPPRA